MADDSSTTRGSSFSLTTDQQPSYNSEKASEVMKWMAESEKATHKYDPRRFYTADTKSKTPSMRCHAYGWGGPPNIFDRSRDGDKEDLPPPEFPEPDFNEYRDLAQQAVECLERYESKPDLGRAPPPDRSGDKDDTDSSDDEIFAQEFEEMVEQIISEQLVSLQGRPIASEDSSHRADEVPDDEEVSSEESLIRVLCYYLSRSAKSMIVSCIRIVSY